MTTKPTKKPIAFAVSTVFAASLAASSPVYADESNHTLSDIRATSFDNGYMQFAATKDNEGKCGEGKCGNS